MISSFMIDEFSAGAISSAAVLDPSILKTERPPVTRARSNGDCARRNTPGPAATPLPRERVRSLAHLRDKAARLGETVFPPIPDIQDPRQLPLTEDYQPAVGSYFRLFIFCGSRS